MSGLTKNLVQKVTKPKHLSIFVDNTRIVAKGGTGGDGCISMLSVFANEFAGPDGGNGGNGGHVVLKADKTVKSLKGIGGSYIGRNGQHGKGKCMFGESAPHVFLNVPVGTIVTPAKPKEVPDHKFEPDKSEVIAELNQDGSMFIAARGGSGGRGNATYLSNLNRHPRVAQAGAKGEWLSYDLRMRIFAHFALVGLPNAGKSTLLKTLTGAQVKVGDYEFTTLHPQVGVIEYSDYNQLAISDLPGIIEESHLNRGLGIQFLRSIQRCLGLLYVIDLTSEDPIRQLEILFRELDEFKQGLSKTRHLIIGNKIDHPEAARNVGPLQEYIRSVRPDTTFFTTSSQTGANLEKLRLELRKIYDSYYDSHKDDIDDAFIW